MVPIKVVAGVVIKDYKILIARKKEGKSLAGFWEFPGGKIEENETSEKALQRELFEEFGIKVNVRDFINSSIYHYPNISIELIGYFASFISGEIQLSDHDRYLWVKPEELKQFDFAPADIPLLKMVEKSSLV